MDIISILLIAISLAMDAFAVSIAVSLNLKTVSKRQIFRLSFHTGFFQFMMPIIGWYFGYLFIQYIKAFDHWIAFILLSFIGIKMIYESFNEDDEINVKNKLSDPTRGFSLIYLCVATSIDALAVGVSLAMLNVNIWYPSIIIGLVTSTLSFIGMKIGEKLGKSFGNFMEITGGIILILIGTKILIEHTCL